MAAAKTVQRNTHTKMPSKIKRKVEDPKDTGQPGNIRQRMLETHPLLKKGLKQKKSTSTGFMF